MGSPMTPILQSNVACRRTLEAQRLTEAMTPFCRGSESPAKWSRADPSSARRTTAGVTAQRRAIGAVAFCAVVILTIFAAETFDPRTMWDAAEGRATVDELHATS
jgi:paraquat-inducible protein A